MVNVRIRKGMTAATLAIPAVAGLAGCTADAAKDDVALGSQDQTASVAGSGAITLHGWSVSYGSTSGGDEMIRVGEKLHVTTALDDVLQLLYTTSADKPIVDALKKDPSKLTLALRVSYTRHDGSTYDAPEIPMKLGPGSMGLTVATSDELVVPKQVRGLRFDLAASFDVGNGPMSRQLLAPHAISTDFVVFGAYVPNKLALFDTMGADRRVRVVEGGAIVRGADVLFSYTDWRLDTLCDKYRLDRKVGDRDTYSRFGPMTVDALGEIDYVVSAVVSTDGGATWAPIVLSRNGHPDVFSRSEGYRYTMEAEVPIPASAGNSLQIAFHVQAYLQVPSFSPGAIRNARYAPGSRILLKDVWDNNDGKNYSLPVGNE
jgi:hypothetical protein